MSGRNWARKTIRPLSCVPRKLSWPSTPPMPLSTPSAANRSMNPCGFREAPSPSWYACRTTARLAFSRSVRWRLVSGSGDGGTGAEPGRLAADAWPASVLPASAATVGTAARAALRPRNERRFVEDMVIPFGGLAASVGWTSQRVQAHRRDGERSSPDPGDTGEFGSAVEVSHQQVRIHAGGVGGACHVRSAAGHGDRGRAGEAVRRGEDGPRGAAGGDEVNLVQPGLRREQDVPVAGEGEVVDAGQPGGALHGRTRCAVGQYRGYEHR